MIDNSAIDINAVTPNSTVKLQTEVSEPTKNYLRIEAIRQHLTMGQLLDKIIERCCLVPEITS